MGGFSSPTASPGGGDATSSYDPQQYLGGQSSDGASSGAPQGSGPSPDFVQSMGRIGMKLDQQIDTLSSQYPQAAEDFRAAKMALKKGMAKIMTTDPQASSGPMAPRTA